MSPFLGRSRIVSRAVVVGIVLAVSLHLAGPRAFGLLLQRRFELFDMAEEAQIVCTAEVLSTQSQWKADHRGRHIYSHVRLGVGQWIKGAARGPYLDLEVVGGTVGDITEIVSDTPVFVRGEQVLLFLKGSPLYVVAGALGKMPVLADQFFWRGRLTSIHSFASSLGVGRIQALAEPSDVLVVEPNEMAPKITAIEPDIASAGTNTEVNIVGSGFGDGQELVVPMFHFFDPELSGPDIEAPVISWSDTRLVCTVPFKLNGHYSVPFGSGQVCVSTRGLSSNYLPFRITFAYSGFRRGENPVVEYYINEDAPDCSSPGIAIEAAASAWNNTGASFQLRHVGPCTGHDPNWNGVNEIVWSRGWLDPAITFSWLDDSGRLKECDMVFSTDFTWSTAPVTDRNHMDVQTVALHEFGHWLLLADLYGDLGDREYDTAKVMYGVRTPGQIMRDLHPDDVAGIHYIYPPATPPAVPSSIDYPFGTDDFYTVHWGACSAASSYQLERSDNGGDWAKIYSGPHTFFDESVREGSYRYRVKASNVVGSSDWQTGNSDCLVSIAYKGSGVDGDPFLIGTPEQLDRIGTHSKWWNRHFRLAADLNMSAYDGREGRPAFHIIAPGADPNELGFQGTPWTGVFDGNGCTISHLTITGAGHMGLFGRSESVAQVRNLRMVDVNITGSGSYVGGLLGENAGIVANCSIAGAVSGDSCVGALVGENYGKVYDSRSAGEVTGNLYVGGLAGRNGRSTDEGRLLRCFSAAVVTGGVSVGGLVGENHDVASVSDCYSTGVVSGSMRVGGLVGENSGTVSDCYSTGMVTGSDAGGLVGGCSPVQGGMGIPCFIWGRVESCYFLTLRDGGGPDNGRGKPLTSVAMRQQTSFVGWDFVGETEDGRYDVWCMPADGYPRLSWEGPCQ